MIYFMQATDGGPIKIGHSGDIGTRVRTLKSVYGKPLVVLATMEGGRPEEQAIHEQFARYRIGETEQFRPAPELMEFIGRPELAAAEGVMAEAMSQVKGQRTVMVFKADPSTAPAFKAWLEGLAAHLGTSVVGVFDMALSEYAESRGLRPMPKRLVR